MSPSLPARPSAPPSGVRRRRGLRAAGRAALLLFASLVLLGAVGATVAVAGFLVVSRDLPDPAMLEQIEFPEQSVIYDRTGKTELARFGDFQRKVVAWADIPPVLVDATTAVEDRTFWENAGFDPLAIASAGLDTIRGQSRGASTITQQLVRQRLLDRDLVPNNERSATRKIREIIQSIRLTQTFPGEEGKQRIMAAYLNQNYYGNDTYGVAAAAEAYFGKPLDKVTLAEAAILAAIPQAPSDYDLVRNAEEECVTAPANGEECTETRLVVPADARIVQRRNLVLDSMAEGRTPLTGDTFSAADFAAAKREPVVLAPQKPRLQRLPQFVFQVRTELVDRLCGTEAETCPVLERGGLTVTTTIDLRLQAIAERWVKAAVLVPQAKDPKAAAAALDIPYQRWMAKLRDNNLRNGALVALDYQTGELVAYVGSADETATTSTPAFQPRFDVLSSGFRQPGSAFKPIVYATGIEERRLTAASMLMDVVTDFGGGYTPTNADNLERGPVRVTDALRFSLNVPAVKAAAVTGVDRILERSEAFGLEFQDASDAGLSVAVGVEEVRPVDLVGAYGALANGGQVVERTTIRSILDGTGADLLDRPAAPATRTAVSPQTAYVMTSILAGNTNPSVNPYWGRFRVVEGDRRRPATLKTGTNNDARDLNAYGYIGAPTASGREGGEYALAVGAWNGNSDNTLVSSAKDPVFSIDVTTYVWQGFLQEATAGWEVRNFVAPEGIVEAAVDPWTGLAASGAQSVTDVFIAGTAPTAQVPQDQRCGEAVLATAGFEDDFPAWLAADRDWIERARRGPGVRGGPKDSATSWFYDGRFTPYGKTWGPILGGGGACETPSPSPSPTETPCASPGASVDPAASGSPLPCPSESTSPSPSPSPSPSDSALPLPSASPALPTPLPTALPSVAPLPTPSPTPAPTPTPTPTAPPSATPSPSPAAGGAVSPAPDVLGDASPTPAPTASP